MCRFHPDEPYWDFATQKVKKASIEWLCTECMRVIHRGEHYMHTAAKYEKKWYKYHTCLQCIEAAKVLGYFCGGWMWYQVIADLKEHGFDPTGSRSAIEDLVFEMERGWVSESCGLADVGFAAMLSRRAIEGLPSL